MYFHKKRLQIIAMLLAVQPLEEEFRQAMATYLREKRMAVGEVGKIFAEIDVIAQECKTHELDSATFEKKIQVKVARLKQIRIICAKSLITSRQVMLHLHDIHVVITNAMISNHVREPCNSLEVPLELTDGLSARFNHLSWNDGVAVGKGMATDEETPFGLYELIPPVNGWYLQIRVTQHYDEDDDDGEEVQPLSTEDRLTYPVTVDYEIIKVRIRNIAVASYSIEDDLESSLDEELVIKVFESAEKGNEVGRAKLNHETKAVMQTLKPGMICELEDKDTQICVLRIDLVDA